MRYILKSKNINLFLVLVFSLNYISCWEYDTPDGHKWLTYNPKDKILGKYVLDSASSSFYEIPRDSCYFILKPDSTAIIANMPNNVRTAENGLGEPIKWEVISFARKKWKLKLDKEINNVYPVKIRFARFNNSDTTKIREMYSFRKIWIKPDSSIYFVKSLGKRECKGNYLVFNKDKTYKK